VKKREEEIQFPVPSKEDIDIETKAPNLTDRNSSALRIKRQQTVEKRKRPGQS